MRHRKHSTRSRHVRTSTYEIWGHAKKSGIAATFGEWCAMRFTVPDTMGGCDELLREIAKFFSAVKAIRLIS